MPNVRTTRSLVATVTVNKTYEYRASFFGGRRRAIAQRLLAQSAFYVLAKHVVLQRSPFIQVPSLPRIAVTLPRRLSVQARS
jgi:hypothetical protein